MILSILKKSISRIMGYCNKHYSCDSCRIKEFCGEYFNVIPSDWDIESHIEEKKEEKEK